MFKKLRWLLYYIKTIKKHLPEISSYFIKQSEYTSYKIKSVKIDRAYRLYTVLNFPPETEENIEKYGYYFMDNETRKFMREFDAKLSEYGLFELVGLSTADKLSPNSVLIVVEFKLMSISKLIKKLIKIGIFGLILMILILIILL